MSSHPINRRSRSRSTRAISKCRNGKYRIGNGSCIYTTRAQAVTARG